MWGYLVRMVGEMDGQLNFFGKFTGKQKIRLTDGFNNLLKSNLFHRIAHDGKEWTRLGETFALQ